MLIRLNPNAPPEQSSLMIYKRGDDLRQDYAVQTMFFIFNRLWALSSMHDKPFIHQYKYVVAICKFTTNSRIVPMGSKMGVLEFVSGCQGSGQYQWYIRFSIFSHSRRKKLNSTLKGSLSKEDKYTFILSMAGSYIGCWVLGIRDRHQDNMMIKDNKMRVTPA